MPKGIKRKYILYILIPYLAVFLLPSTVYVHLFRQELVRMQRDIENGSLTGIDNIVRNTSNLVDDLMLEITNLSLQVTGTHVSPVAELKNALNDTQLQTQMALKCVASPILSTSYVMLFDENKVITPFVAGNELTGFYGKFFEYENLSFDEFRALFTQRHYENEMLPFTEISRNGSMSSEMMIVQSIPNSAYHAPTGVIVFVLDLSYADALLRDSLPEQGGAALAYRLDDGRTSPVSQVVTADFDRSVFDGLLSDASAPEDGVRYIRRFFVGKSSSANGELYGIVVQPSASAFNAVRSFSLVILLQAAFVLCVVGAIIFRYTKRNLNSLQAIIETFSAVDKTEPASWDVFTYVQNAADKTVQQIKQLSSHMEKQRLIVTDAFFRKLLRGDYVYESDVIGELENLKLSINHNCYIVVIYVFKEAAAHDKQLLRQYLAQYFTAGLYLIDYDQTCTVSVIGSDMDAGDAAQETDVILSRYAPPRPRIVCAGNPVRKLCDIAQAYKEACYVRNNLGNAAGPVIWYQDIYAEVTTGTPLYDLDAERKLISHILVGDTAEVETSFEALYQSISDLDDTTVKSVKCLVHDLYRLANHILTVKNQADDTELVLLNRMFDAVAFGEGDHARYFDYIKELCVKLSENNKKNRNSKSAALTEKIISFINANRSDAQLCVKSIADHCGISPKYLSEFFKEQQNENISNYIERLRIEQACELLKNHELSINGIAESVGYTSAYTFRAAFKRNRFLTPREFRERL